MAYTKHSNGRLFRFLTGSPHYINKQYSIGVQKTQKLQQPYKESLQPFFRNKKPQNPYLQILVFLPHLSSSSDLRILSSTQPSQISPMTDFRLSVGASTHTAAVPSGIHTRFSILLWGCYRVHRHLNGIFTCMVSIREYNANVNRKSRNLALNKLNNMI